MKNLISSIDYGKYLDSMEISNALYRFRRQVYDAFLERPIQKSDCVTCDENGNVLEYPKELFGSKTTIYRENKLNEYQQAKEKVTFEGFEFKHGLISYQGNVIDEECFGITKIKDLIEWKLTLTKPF